MTTFALDCSQKNLTMALFDGNTLLASCDEDVGHSHSQRLLICFDELLKASNQKVSDIDTVLYATGPGSFTSLRIGLAFLKGVFDSTAICFIKFSSLRYRCLVLQQTSKSNSVCCAFSLGRGRFIAGQLDGDSYEETLCDAKLWQDLKSKLQSAHVIVCEADFKRDPAVLKEMSKATGSSRASLNQVQLDYVIPPDIG